MNTHTYKTIFVIVVFALALVPLLVQAQSTDTIAPTTPQNPFAAPVSSSAIEVTWSTSTDNTGTIGYGVWRGNVRIATSTNTRFLDINLQPSTPYNYRIRALDAAGNTSPFSATTSTTTLAASSGSGSSANINALLNLLGGVGSLGSGSPNATTGQPAPESFSEDYQFQRSGIFGCNRQGAYAMSGGTFAAIGGVYVPVNDAAVTLNSGALVYKECVLDGVNTRLRESASSAHQKLGLTSFLTGRDGKPYFPVDYIADVLARSDETVLRVLQSGELNTINPAFQGEIVRTLARDYMAQTRASQQTLACPYRGDLNAVLRGTTNDVYGGLLALTNPACNPLGAFHQARDYSARQIALQREEMLFRLNNSYGIYGVEEYDPETGRHLTRTPGIVVAGNTQQLIQSGFRQLENATEIDQMVGALFSGLSTHVMSDSRGLTGILESAGGQPSYLDQVARESAQGVRDAATNAALQILAAARSVETAYLNAMNGIAKHLTSAIQRLRDAERQCWELLIPEVRQYAQSQNFSVTVATSTVESQRIIDTQIAPLASIAVANIEAAESGMTLIERLINGLRDTTSLDAQRVALQQLDSLVAQGALHTQFDANQATQREADVEGAMNELVEDTIELWADSTTPDIGWCNVNNDNTVRLWAERWRN